MWVSIEVLKYYFKNNCFACFYTTNVCQTINIEKAINN